MNPPRILAVGGALTFPVRLLARRSSGVGEPAAVSRSAVERRASAQAVFPAEAVPFDRQRTAGLAVPLVAVLAACGVLIVAFAYALSRSGRPFAEPLFWAGLVMIILPATVPLFSPRPSRMERLSLVCLTGLALYLVKVLNAPFQFLSSDGPVHEYNAIMTLRTGRLLSENPILSVTPRYPGLEAVTGAIASTTGLSAFGAGILVLAAAKVVVMTALFLLYEELSGSARVAGLAAVAYTANPNFVFFDSQYAYESLALPLVTAAMFGVARWMRLRNRPDRSRAATVIALVTLGVIMTHHMSSYALTGFLVLVVVAQLFVVRGAWWRAPIALTLFTIAAIIGWLTFVASDTVGYLTPVFTKAFRETFQTIGSETAPRQVFESSEGVKPPLWDRGLGLAAAAIVLLALPFGLRVLWARYRKIAVALVLAAASLAYVGALFLRLVPGAWEVGSRASEFTFIGAAFVLALAAFGARPKRLRRSWPIALIAAFVVLFAGGLVAGRANDLRLSKPYAVRVGSTTIYPQGAAAGVWTGDKLGVNRRFAADPSSGRLLLVEGPQFALVGKNPAINVVLARDVLRPWHVDLLRSNHVDYLLIDRRKIRGSPTRGNYFCVGPCPLVDHASYAKFDRRRALSRVFDSGTIAIYDIRRWTDAGPGA